MDFEFSDEQRLLANTVERFGADRYGDGQRAAYLKSETGFSGDGWRLMAETGLLAIPFSEDHGGLGGDASDLICVMKPLGHCLAAEPLLGGPVLAGGLLDRIGTQAQIETWAPRIIDGSAQIALAHAEKAARFRLDFVETVYSGAGGRTTATGRKTFILAGGTADVFIVSAVADAQTRNGDARGGEIRFFLIDAGAEGLTRRNYRLADGAVACEIDLRNVAAEPMDGGFDDFLTIAAQTKVAACAEMVGVMERLFEATVDYVKNREQFGQPLGKFQVIQHRLADLYASLELSRSHLYRMASVDIDEEAGRQAISGSKAYIAGAAMKLAEEAVQLHGGMGVTDELFIGDGLKKIMVLSTLFGDPPTELARYL